MADNSNKNSILERNVARRISKELLSMSGVSSLAGDGITKAIANTVLRKKDSVKGIDVSIADEEIYVDLRINVYYGINIPQLSYDIQTKVKPIIEDMTNLKIKAINISVEGIEQ